MIDWRKYQKTGQISETENCDLSLAECSKLAGVSRGATEIAESMSVSRRQVDNWFNDNRWKFDNILIGLSIRKKLQQVNAIAMGTSLSIRDLPEKDNSNDI